MDERRSRTVLYLAVMLLIVIGCSILGAVLAWRSYIRDEETRDAKQQLAVDAVLCFSLTQGNFASGVSRALEAPLDQRALAVEQIHTAGEDMIAMFKLVRSGGFHGLDDCPALR